jgi:endogenous inhibitor of DNA gyrase (YacG/DUF329 family)
MTEKSCPICGKPEQAHAKPFCSQRCKNVDLHRWLSGKYAIPAVEAEDEEEDAPPLPSPPLAPGRND